MQIDVCNAEQICIYVHIASFSLEYIGEFFI